MTGVPFMQNTLGASARLVVEIAWGADLSASPGTWSWTDITADVYQAGGSKIGITVGRADEAATTQPAACSLVVDNRGGGYSQGGQSPNWPNVRRNTPLRVRVDPDGSGFDTRFFGKTTGFSPSWDSTGRDARVTIAAAGELRRLAQGNAPVVSPFRRAILARTDIVAYWPCEDAKLSTMIAADHPGGLPMTISSIIEHPYPEFASNEDFACSAALPVLKQSAWHGAVPTYASTGTVSLSMLIRMPEQSLSGTTCVLATAYLSGTIARVEFYYSVGGNLGLRGFTTAGASAFDTGNVGFNADNTVRLYTVQLVQNGANVDYQIQALAVGWPNSGLYGGTATTQTVGVCTAVAIGANKDVLDAAIGHVYVGTTAIDVFDLKAQLNANSNEITTVRLSRLCAENGVGLTYTATPGVLPETGAVTMGQQSVSPLLALLRECEAADQGLLYDGLGPGLVYAPRIARENGAAALTLNAATGDPAKDVTPTDDDQRTINKVAASRTSGPSVTYADIDGPLGTDDIDDYSTTMKININHDLDLIDYASWRVHQGTVEGYRWPKLQLDLAKRPALAPAWSAAPLNCRIDVTNLSTVRAQLPAGTLSLLVEGYTEQIDQFRWDVVLNCSPYVPWRIGTVAAESGDTSPTVLRLVSDGSTLASSATLGATSLSIATPSGPLWTTAADDLPFDISVGGIIVHVTAISGSSSPQTFTVSAISRALPSGLGVELYQPLVLGL